MPQLSRYLSFLFGKGGKTLYLKPYCKNFKNTQVHLLTNPYNAPGLDLQCICDAPQNCPTYYPHTIFYFIKTPTTQILLSKLNHFSKSFIKIILHNHLFNFEDTSQNLQFVFFFPLKQKKKREQCSNIFSFSALYMFKNVLIVHLLFQLCTCSGMCFCTPILYICHVIQFCLYFTQVKDGSYHINLLPLFYAS